MFVHNKNLELDNEDIQDGLAKLIERATENNIYCWEKVLENKHDEARKYADIRDAYLNSYYLITGVNVDYGNLKKEW